MAFKRQVKNFVKNYSDAEIKVREATSNDPWGPSGSLMLAISDLTFNAISLSEIMNMLWQRLNDHGKNWRHVYKSLMLLDYLIKNGSKEVIEFCIKGFCNLKMLEDFQHIDEAGKDQGYYIRKKSKQVISLLMDKQLLHKEREVAHQTRWRSSCSVTFSKRLPGTGNSTTAWASDPTPEVPASEKKRKLLKVARLRKKKNPSKAEVKQEQQQEPRLPSEVVVSQEAMPVKCGAWKSAEDLMLFYDDDPKPLLPTAPSALVSSTAWLSEGRAEVCNLWDTDAVPTPSEKNPSLQTNVSLDKNSDSTIAKAVTENPLQMPPEKQSATKRFEELTTLPAFWSSSKEESMSPNLGIFKSDSTFCDQASVETLYISPSFQTFGPVKETVISKDSQKPTQPSVAQTDDENLKTLTTWVSTTSEVTSSFSTLSMSSPDSATPEKSAPLLPPVLARPSFWALAHRRSALGPFADKDETASARHPFVPRGPGSSDKETDSSSPLDVLPDDSDSAKKTLSPMSRSNWVEFSTQNVGRFTCSRVQETEGLPKEPEANNSIQVLLGEVKNAIVKLHEDLSLVIQELGVINSHLVSLGGNSLQTGPALQFPPPPEGSSEQI
ncbi:ENTH domain-containing protein 1 [Pteronotus mesoamericanus]|uniref:ENTH domain-containing protein 1 n=1 Tax=Pteronotus mesoamericanus TaxID=1884717 RepID=UPI0023EBB64D|nr:ENTH domain-containing protein 1 [Pteronotus parnellii mesoamericanus]